MSIQKNVNLFLNIAKIFFAEIPEGVTSDISSMDENTDGSVSITFNTDKDWKQIYFTKGTATFSQKHKIVDEGDLFEQTVEFSYPGESLETQNQIKALLRKPLMFKIEIATCDGSLNKIIGSPDSPVFLSEDLKTQDYNTTRKITVYGESVYPAPFLSI